MQARHRSVTPQSPRSKGRYDHVQPKVDSGRRRSKTPPPRRVAPAAATSPASARSAPTGGYAASRGGCGSGYPRNRPRDPQRPLPVTAAAATTPASEPAAEPVAAPSQQPPSASYFTASACDSYTALGGYDAGFGTASPQLPEAQPQALPLPQPQPFFPHESDTQACAREAFERDVFGGALRCICDESLVTDASFAAPSTLNLRPSRRRSRKRDGGGARSPRGRRTRDASVGDTDEDAAVARVYAETLSRVEDMERGLDLQLIGAGGGGGSGGGAGGHSNLLALDVHLLQQEMRQADARAAALRQALHEQAVLKEREAEELRRLSESLHDEERGGPSPSGAGGGRGRLRHHGSVAAPPLPSYVLSDDAPVFDATAGASVPEWREGISGGSGGGAALKGRARVEGGDDVG
eukprot:Rhum_TRINITY_DN14321_c23_g1::Rhum_TRINITY_DN14321_c23_g1_i1::g.81515::m.81515